MTIEDKSGSSTPDHERTLDGLSSKAVATSASRNETNPWERFELWVNNKFVKLGSPVPLKRGQDNVVSLKGPSEIKSVRIGLADGGGMTIVADPLFQAPLPQEDGVFRCKITPGADLSGLGMLVVYSSEVPLPWAWKFVVMWEDLAKEVESVLLDGEKYDKAAWFFRSVSKTIEMIPKSGSPLNSMRLTPEFIPLTGLQGDDGVVAETGLNESTLTVLNRSGTFRLQLVGPTGFMAVALPESKAMSTDLRHEVKEIRLNGLAYPPNHVFIRGVSGTLSLIYHTHSPIAGYTLDWVITLLSGLQPGDVVITLTGPHTWTITASHNSGTFEFELGGVGFATGIQSAINTVLSPDLDDEVNVLVNGELIPIGADLIGGDNVTLTLQYLNRDVMKNVYLALDVNLKEGLAPGDISTEPPLRQLTRQHEWGFVAPNKAGVFNFEVSTKDKSAKLLTPENRIKTKADEVNYFFYKELGQDPLDEFVLPYNQILDQFYVVLKTKDGNPMAGVTVNILQKDVGDGLSNDWVTKADGSTRIYITNDGWSAGYFTSVHATASSLPGKPHVVLPLRIV